jgi:hypothetical protein
MYVASSAHYNDMLSLVRFSIKEYQTLGSVESVVQVSLLKFAIEEL